MNGIPSLLVKDFVWPVRNSVVNYEMGHRVLGANIQHICPDHRVMPPLDNGCSFSGIELIPDLIRSLPTLNGIFPFDIMVGIVRVII